MKALILAARARRLSSALPSIMLGAALGYYLYPVAAVDMVFGQPPRPVLSPEVATWILCSTLPTLTSPSTDGRERRALPSRKLVLTMITAMLMACCALPYLVYRFHFHMAGFEFQQPFSHFLVGAMTYAAWGFGVHLLLGRRGGAFVALLGCIAVPIVQNYWPHSPVTWFFVAGRSIGGGWCWIGAAGALLLVLVADWRRGGVPILRDRPHLDT